MELIQYEKSEDVNNKTSMKGSMVKGTCEITSKPLKKWSYNGIYMSHPMYEVKQK